MRRMIFLIALILLVGKMIHAQDGKTIGLSLQQCVQMAVENNINVRTACIDLEKSEFKKAEMRAALLPKMNLNGSFQDNLSLPTTLIPGDFVGTPGQDIAMQMGSQYNANASVSISQVIYNRTALLALEITKKSETLSELSVEKASEEIATEVSRLYFLILTTSEQQKLIEENIARAEKLKNIAGITVDNGMGKQVDLDRVNVNLENYYTQLSNTQVTLEQQMNMMRYLLDLPLEQDIVLTDKADTTLLQIAPDQTADLSDHIEIQLLESQQEINILNQKSIKSGYLPTLSLSGAFAWQGLKSDFQDYFDKNNKWYSSSYVNLSLSIPLFDSFEKHAKSRQATLEYQKTREKLDAAKENISMNYKNAMNNCVNQRNNVTRQQQNLKLAEKVFDETSLKYKEGMAAMTNLLQDEISLNNAQSAYLTSLYNLKDSEVKIMSINGEIKNLFNK